MSRWKLIDELKSELREFDSELICFEFFVGEHSFFSSYDNRFGEEEDFLKMRRSGCKCRCTRRMRRRMKKKRRISGDELRKFGNYSLT